MTFVLRCCLVTACLLPLACSPGPGGSAGRISGNSDAHQEFSGFCQNWMEKLRVRERSNLAKLRLRSVGSQIVGEYTGYGSGALECSAASTGLMATPFVGTLIYREIHYSKRGKDRKRALKSEPRTLRTIEVTELFRYDGTRWLP